MNKKILFLILLIATLVLPFAVSAAATAGGMALKVQKAAETVATSVVIIGWIVAGILYLTAGGGPRMEIAKKALVACVIGTVLVILAKTAEGFISDLFDLGGGGGAPSSSETPPGQDPNQQ